MDFLQRLDRALQEARIIPQPGSIPVDLGRPESNQPCEYCGATSKVSAVPGDNKFTYTCAQCFINLRLGARYVSAARGKPGELPQLQLRRRRRVDPDHIDIEYRGD